MTEQQNKFDEAVWSVVSSIASGRVKSYGEVARAAGYPRHARMVSKAMVRSAEPLPWHRVVRSNRTLAFEVGSKPYIKQRGLLAKEGVRIVNGNVVPLDSDEMLWGPPE